MVDGRTNDEARRSLPSPKTEEIPLEIRPSSLPGDPTTSFQRTNELMCLSKDAGKQKTLTEFKLYL